tara:strand:+ start:378 stop:638 length:261 start_codon:yes stop_codon:yes gene_type:complete
MTWEDIVKGPADVKLINNYIMFINNTNAFEKIEILFGQPYDEMEGHRKSYVKKFMDVHTDVVRLWGMLDLENRQKLVDAAIDKYGR